MNDLEKMKKEVEQKKKALNAIYGKESMENDFATVKESLWHIYDVLNSKIENAKYRYEVTKDPELKGEIDAYNDILVLLETKFTFLTRTNNVQSSYDDSVKIPDGISRRLTKITICPYCKSRYIKALYKITKVNNWDEQKTEKVIIRYKCLNCGNEFSDVVLDNTNNIDSNNIDHTEKIPYSEDTSFSFTTKENKDANAKEIH